MYSQCPQCQAVFSVSEAHVSAHHGLVRCGHCRAVFHAVTNQVAGPQRPVEEPSAPVQRDIEESFNRGAAGVEAPPPPESQESDEARGIPDEPSRDVPDERKDPAAAATDAPGAEPVDKEIEQPAEPYPDPGFDEEVEEVNDTARSTVEYADAETRDGTEEPVLPAVEVNEAERVREASQFEGEVEEILIEAPPVLWNVFDEEFDDKAPAGPAAADAAETPKTWQPPEQEEEAEAEPARPKSLVDRLRRPGPGKRRSAPSPPAAPRTDGEDVESRRAPLKSPYRARDIRMVELPQPKPFKTMSLSLLSIFLVLLLVWQAKTFYLDELAQVPVFRPFLEQLCRPLGCVLPPRRNFAQIDLVGTSISLNPEVPGALEIKASLINRAHFPQPYPMLRITLTDREGRVVGRRTYLPSEYRQDDGRELLPTSEVRDVSINLAQPAENAVGYEVELVAPHSENS